MLLIVSVFPFVSTIVHFCQCLCIFNTVTYCVCLSICFNYHSFYQCLCIFNTITYCVCLSICLFNLLFISSMPFLCIFITVTYRVCLSMCLFNLLFIFVNAFVYSLQLLIVSVFPYVCFNYCSL